MSKLVSYLAEKHRVWAEPGFSGRQDVAVSTLRPVIKNATTTWLHDSQNVRHRELTTWLGMAPSPDDAQRTMRFVWLPLLLNGPTIDVARELFEDVQYSFGHRVALQYCTTVPAGVGKFEDPSRQVQLYFFSMHPKVIMIWSIEKDSGPLNVMCIAEAKKLQAMKTFLDQDFTWPVDGQRSHIPALICATLLFLEIEQKQEEIKQQVRQVEVRTGHHDWKTRSEGAALGDLTSLSAKMSGCSTRCGSSLRKQHLLVEVLEFVKREASMLLAPVAAIHHHLATGNMSDAFHVLVGRATALRTDNGFIQHRVDTQLNALQNLVAQNDAYLGQQMAADSRLVAMASQKDASSMKVISIVTMSFLPGTFVASVFSIPLFDWDAQEKAVMLRHDYWAPKLTVYIAVALPLTALTFAIWAFAMFITSIRDRKKAQAAAAQLRSEAKQDEARVLALRRSTLQSLAD